MRTTNTLCAFSLSQTYGSIITSMTTLALPAGWRRVQSNTRPGEHYYISPAGPTWDAPDAAVFAPGNDATHSTTSNATRANAGNGLGRDAHTHTNAVSGNTRPASGPTPPKTSGAALNGTSHGGRRPFVGRSLYQQDYHEHDPTDSLVERADRLTRFNPSTAPHPKAKPDNCKFASVTRSDFTRHDVVPEGSTHQWEYPGPMKPLNATSTHRTDFQPRVADIVRHKRSRTPPKPTPFLFNSTQRATYSAEAVGVTQEQLAATSHSARLPPPPPPPVKSDFTTHQFNDAAHLTRGRGGAVAPSGSASGRSTPRRSSRQPTGPGIFGFTAFAKMGSAFNSEYRSSFAPGNEPRASHGAEARAYGQRGWEKGLNRSRPDQFDSTYLRSYREETDPKLPGVMRECHDVDRRVKERAKEHQDFSDP
jgi:hypothetical protein